MGWFSQDSVRFVKREDNSNRVGESWIYRLAKNVQG